MFFEHDARQRLINFINHERETSTLVRPFDFMKEDLVYNLISQEPDMAKSVLRLHSSDVEYCTINNKFYDDVPGLAWHNSHALAGRSIWPPFFYIRLEYRNAAHKSPHKSRCGLLSKNSVEKKYVWKVRWNLLTLNWQGSIIGVIK